jgi:hypothetical protein
MDKDDELEMAETHVRRGEQLVARQRELVARLSSADLGFAVACDLLEKLEITLAGFRDHRDVIRREVEVAKVAAGRARRRPAGSLDGPARPAR